MVSVPDLSPRSAADLLRVAGPIHNLVYFVREVDAFKECGLKGWWMGYFASRAAPLGEVPVEVVVAIFYNFASRMIERALPQAWEILPRTEALAVRLEVVDRALRRILGDRLNDQEIGEAAGLLRRATEGLDVSGRPLYAAHAALPWPDAPHLALWHACTLVREHRFDGHNSALAAAELDGVSSHVAMVARGHGNRASILPIRGYTEEEWAAAEARLRDRGWLKPDGTFTPAGKAGRDTVEEQTNCLALEPVRRLGPNGLHRLSELLSPIVRILHETGEVPGEWPPKHLLRPEPSGGVGR